LTFANSVVWNGTSWFVSGIIGGNNALLNSSDGITWIPVESFPITPLYALASRRLLPYIADTSLAPRTINNPNINNIVSFTIYLGFTSPTLDLISKIYIPPGLLASGASGTFTSSSLPTDVSISSGFITLTNTTYPALLGMYGQAYNSGTGGWSPIANIGGPRLTYNVPIDTTVTIGFTSLTFLNGGVFDPPTNGIFDSFLVTFTLTYLNTDL
jgi:hypothetical protein